MTERRHILVVEDSPTQRQRLIHYLEQGGYTVTAAANGIEALAELARGLPALVVSDVMMPEMNGYELCRRIKDNPATCDVPVILVTYLSETLDVVRGLEAGADNFIMKPYEPDFLLSRIGRTLEAAAEESSCPPEFPLQIEGRTCTIRSDRRRILEILLSTYETALQKNERLKAAQDELRKTNEELEAFSYSVSHDLRTPLAVITGYGEFLWFDYRDRLDDNARNYLAMIRQAAEKMDHLIGDLLKLSRATRAEMTRERIDLTAMLQEIAADLRRNDPERQVELRIAEGMTIFGDAPLLRIAFENLLRNAWKFTSKTPLPRIEAGWEPGPETVYYVRDNGAGFDMQEADKLFTSFQRLHSDTEFPGTGIGLTIVERIVTRHGGRIWAEGKVGEGATFFLALKREPASA